MAAQVDKFQALEQVAVVVEHQRSAEVQRPPMVAQVALELHPHILVQVLIMQAAAAVHRSQAQEVLQVSVVVQVALVRLVLLVVLER